MFLLETHLRYMSTYVFHILQIFNLNLFETWKDKSGNKIGKFKPHFLPEEKKI